MNFIGVGSSTIIAHHRQGDYSDIGNKTNHPITHMNNANNKKILNIQDQHTRYDDISKKLGSTPKLCQNGILNNNNGINGGNITKSENHHYNNNTRVSQGN